MPLHRYRPLYAACNEDSDSELAALEIGRGDEVVSICAGGGRALSLLTAEPGRLVAIDRRADQLFQLELKAAAMSRYDYDSFCDFVGLTRGRDRRDAYSELRFDLSPSARRYWDRRLPLVEQGILYAGRLERSMSGAVGLVRRLGMIPWTERYFAAEDLPAQLAMLAESPSVLETERYWRVFCHPIVAFAATQDPGFLRADRGGAGAELFRRFRRYVTTHLGRDSAMLHLLYFGRYDAGGALPAYLRPDGFERARKALDRLVLTQGDVADHAARTRTTRRLKWSLSDIGAWMSGEHFERVLREVVDHGGPGSRFCARSFLARRRLPPDLRARRLDALCDALDANDASVFYRFEVAEYGR